LGTCECDNTDSRNAAIPPLLAGCTVVSKCECLDELPKPEEIPEQETISAPKKEILIKNLALTADKENGDDGICLLTYWVTCLQNSTVAITKLIVDNDVYPFANPIAAGQTQAIATSRPKPADCVTKNTGIVEFQNGLKLNGLKVCQFK